MKLYSSPLSPYAARCRMVIYWTGLPVQIRQVTSAEDLAVVRQLSPLGKYPILVEGDFRLLESQVIAEYLAQHSGLVSLLPEGLQAHSTVAMVCRIADLYLMANMAILFNHLSRKRRDQQVVDRCLAEMDKGFATLEQLLGSGRYAMGDAPSLADCCLFPILLLLSAYLAYFDRAEPFSAWPALNRYWQAVQSDPVCARVGAEMRDEIARRQQA